MTLLLPWKFLLTLNQQNSIHKLYKNICSPDGICWISLLLSEHHKTKYPKALKPHIVSTWIASNPYPAALLHLMARPNDLRMCHKSKISEGDALYMQKLVTFNLPNTISTLSPTVKILSYRIKYS